MAYLAAYVAFSLWAFRDDVTQRRFGAWATVELVGVAVWLFCAGMTALTAVAANQVQRSLADAELPRHRRIWSAALGFAVLVVVNAP